MVVDAQIGITDFDQEVADVLLRTKKPVCLAVNKIDDLTQEYLIYHFRSLGIKDRWRFPRPNRGILRNCWKRLSKKFSPMEKGEPIGSIAICIVGRPNVGKSSLVNYLLDDKRCIVSPIPGTTRDSVDIPFIMRAYLL